MFLQSYIFRHHFHLLSSCPGIKLGIPSRWKGSIFTRHCCIDFSVSLLCLFYLGIMESCCFPCLLSLADRENREVRLALILRLRSGTAPGFLRVRRGDAGSDWTKGGRRLKPGEGQDLESLFGGPQAGENEMK